MNDYIEIIAVVEGKTEQTFIEKLLSPYLAPKKIFIKATQVSKSGQKGGEVKFSRVQKDIGSHLKQRSDTYVTTLVDYYGIREWPGLDLVPPNSNPATIADIINRETKNSVVSNLPNKRAEVRFIPYIALHEFEALLFSDVAFLAQALNVKQLEIEKVLVECREPEAINNHPDTAPSKRLDQWSPNGKFKKTTDGISIAERIGIEKMRGACPVFNEWLNQIEQLGSALR